MNATTKPPTSTTTTTSAPASTTTTTLPAPTVRVTVQGGATEGTLYYATSRNYDVSVCFEATTADGATSRFVNMFHGFAPPEGIFAVMPYPPLGPMTALQVVHFTYASPSSDPLPEPCAGH